MILIMLVSLYTSRVVLQTLGVTDFGIYNVVGGVVSLLAFFTSSLSNVTQRYLCIGLGENDINKTITAFRQSFTIMLMFSAGIFIAGESIGLWFVQNKLVIPNNRATAAFWVYQCSLISIIASINQVTFISAIISRERMGIYAYLGLFEAFARLGIAVLLMSVANVDLLILYAVLLSCVSLLILAFFVIYCVRKFEEAKCKLIWNSSLVKEMSKFVGYNLFGCFAYSGGVQGTNIIMNIFFGPMLNAARGIATQVTSVVNKLTDGIMTAIKPPIIKSYIEGDIDYMFQLIEKSSKYMFFLGAIIAVPAIFEMELLLDLWLGQIPEHTIAFARIALCEQLLWVFIPPLWIVANATGKIKNNQVYGRLITLSALPLSYIMLRIFPEPNLPMYILCAAQLGYWIYCVWDIHGQLNLDILRYIRNVIVPSFVLTAALLICGFFIEYNMPYDTFTRLCVVIISMLAVGVLTIYILIDKKERMYIRSFLLRNRVIKI